MFERFPFTNLHELNLDWIIQQLKDLESHAVLSVNGQTGDVVLYRDPDIVFPDVDSTTWRMVRTAGGNTVGIMFQNGLAYVMDGSQASRIYTVDHPPAYPVTSVNGQTGAVVTYNQAYNRLPGVPEQNTNFYRTVDSEGSPVDVGVQVDKNKLERMSGANRYKVYDEGNTPPYPVTSVNGQTGAVVLAIPFDSPLTDSIWMATDTSEDHTAGLGRETVDGTVQLYTVTDGTHAEAYIHFVSSDDQYNYTKKLLTTDDIPAGAGVISINGLTGVVTLYGDTLPIVQGSAVTVKDEIDSLDSDLAIVENGATATHDISKGHFVVWNYQLYTALSNISIGDTLSLSVLDPVTTGGFNVLHDRIEAIPISTEINIPADNLSPVLVFENYSKHMLALVGTNTDTRTALLFVSCASTGGMSYYAIHQGSNLTIDDSVDNQLTITRSGGTLQVLDFALTGHTITIL